jgi:hypothetical protein
MARPIERHDRLLSVVITPVDPLATSEAVAHFQQND